MKLYYAKSVDGKKTIQFRGETVVFNQPFLFEYLVKLRNEKVNDESKIDIKDYQIMEIEAEIKHEGKRNNG